MKKAAKFLMILLGAALGLGLGVGLAMMLDRMPELPVGAMIAVDLLALTMLYGYFLLNVILHEAGHLLFGLLTGWRFVSFRIGSALWRRGPDGRLTRSKFSLAGTAGQCLMAPPPWREEGFPCVLYNLGGVIVNIATAAIFALAAWALWARPLAALLLIEGAAVALVMGVTNGVPLPGMAVANDGSNLVSMLRSRHARRALWIQMSVAAAQAEGMRLADMPETWFAPFPEAAMDNPLVASVAVFAANRQMDALNLPGAEAAIRSLLRRKTGVLPIYRSLLTLDGACCELIVGRPGDLTEAFATPAVQQIVKGMKTHITILRAQYIVALLRDRDEAQATKYQQAFDRAAARYPYPQDVASERALMALARENMIGKDDAP